LLDLVRFDFALPPALINRKEINGLKLNLYKILRERDLNPSVNRETAILFDAAAIEAPSLVTSSLVAL
jgi:hypothetical protein